MLPEFVSGRCLDDRTHLEDRQVHGDDEAANDDLRELTELLNVPATNQLDREKLIQEIASLEARIAQDLQEARQLARVLVGVVVERPVELEVLADRPAERV